MDAVEKNGQSGDSVGEKSTALEVKDRVEREYAKAGQKESRL